MFEYLARYDISDGDCTYLLKNLIKEGLVLMESLREVRLAGLVGDYRLAQEHAKSSRLCLWRHGDITDDDAVEFGTRR